MIHQSIRLTSAELWLLLGNFAPALIIGIENPYLGWLVEEIEPEQKKAGESLVSSGIAKKVSDGTIEVDDAIMQMMSIIAHPQHTSILQFSSQYFSQQAYIHFANGQIVEHVETDPGEHRLTALPDVSALLERYANPLCLRSTACGRGKPFSLSEQALRQAAEKASGGSQNEATALLEAGGLSRHVAEELTEALTQPLANAAVVVIANQNNPQTQHVRGFGILQSAHDLWVMRPYQKMGQPFVEFVPVDAHQLYQRLLETFPA